MDSNLATALSDLRSAIEGTCLGSIEDTVIAAASANLIVNWNDHLDKANRDMPIDEDAELAHYGLSRPIDGP